MAHRVCALMVCRQGSKELVDWKCQNSGHGVMTHGISPHLLIPVLVSKPSSFAMPFWQGAVAVEL